MQTGSVIYAQSHAGFLNTLLGKNYSRYMRCTYDLKNGYEIWLIRFKHEQTNMGWTNRLSKDGGTVFEFYTGDPAARLDYQKYLNTSIKRLIFEIVDLSNGMRNYVFRGAFAFDVKSNNDYRVWNKISDSYHF